jgi:hypothetical protein
MITIRNIPASATALGYELSEGSVVSAMAKDGLDIGDTYIAFPEEMLDSLTWVVGWKHEIIAGEDRRYLEQSEINEMKALKRLLVRLEKLGGRENLADKYDGEDESETDSEPEVRNDQWQGDRNFVLGGRYVSKYNYTCVVLALRDWDVEVCWDANSQVGRVPFWQMTEEFTLVEGAE